MGQHHLLKSREEFQNSPRHKHTESPNMLFLKPNRCTFLSLISNWTSWHPSQCSFSVFWKTINPGNMRPCCSISLLNLCWDLGRVYWGLCVELWGVWMNDFPPFTFSITESAHREISDESDSYCVCIWMCISKKFKFFP